eukprot:2790440-Rhodomonas_salina.1
MISHATPELRRECEKDLLARYHNELTKTIARYLVICTLHVSRYTGPHSACVDARLQSPDSTKFDYVCERCQADYVIGGVGKWAWLMIQMGGTRPSSALPYTLNPKP